MRPDGLSRVVFEVVAGIDAELGNLSCIRQEFRVLRQEYCIKYGVEQTLKV